METEINFNDKQFTPDAMEYKSAVWMSVDKAYVKVDLYTGYAINLIHPML